MRAVSSMIVVVLVGLTLGSGAMSPRSSDASPDYDAVVNITFPVGGTTSFRDDYHACRGTKCERRHKATDIMAPYGALVYAAMGGTITFITGLEGPVPSYGYMITIRGDDARNYSYIHLGRQNLGPADAYAPGLRRGVRVERGQPIGINGCSGNASCSAPHLHFEIEDARVSDPYGTSRMNPYRSLTSAKARRDLPSGTWLRFADVPVTNNHRSDIEWLADSGITRGCNPPRNDRFCPGGVVTREQMAAFLVRALGLNQTSKISFKDIPAGSTFAADVNRLATAGITRGCNPPVNDRFCPGDAVTREQMAAFLGRALGLPAAKRASFRDVSSSSTFLRDIDRLAAAGVTRGCNPPTNDRFCPTDAVTRAQMASFLRRGLPQG